MGEATTQPKTDYFRMPRPLWRKLKKYLPKRRNTESAKGGRPRASERAVADAIWYVLWTGCQWKALHRDWFGVSSSVALAVATLGFYVAAMSSFAKPASAAVSCNPGTYAYAPIQKDLSTGVRVIQFNAAMRCSGVVDSIGVEMQGEIRSAGGQWYNLENTYRGIFTSDSAAVSQLSRYSCGYPPYTTSITVRTHTLSGYTKNNGVEKIYPQRFSVAKTFAC